MTLPEFQIFVKPVGSLCNLACEYCYYLEKSNLYTNSLKSTMTSDILKKYIIQHIEASQSDIISFSWHGGEPMLAGIEFYRKVVEIQKRNLPSGKKILNGLQTNGTLINSEWCEFFSSENFTIGISLDGPEKFHNTFRLTKNAVPTFQKVLNGFDQLVLHGIDPEILCVVNAENSLYPLEVYQFFQELGATYITFIPLVERLGAESIEVSKNSVKPLDFGNFLCTIFDEWVQHDIGKIKVQIFEEALRTAFNQEHALCIFKEKCGMVPIIEHNGDLYSCDHYVQPEYLIGNINSNTISHLLNDKKQLSFGRDKQNKLPTYCMECNVKAMCNGECPKNRFITSPRNEEGLNYLCEGYKKFFHHCTPIVNAIRTAWEQENKK